MEIYAEAAALIFALVLIVNIIVLSHKENSKQKLSFLIAQSVIIICSLAIAADFTFAGAWDQEGGNINFKRRLEAVESKTDQQDEKLSELLNQLVPETEILFAMAPEYERFSKDFSELLQNNHIPVFDTTGMQVTGAEQIQGVLINQGARFKLPPEQLKTLYRDIEKVAPKGAVAVVLDGKAVSNQEEWSKIIDDKASYFNLHPKEKIEVLIKDREG